MELVGEILFAFAGIWLALFFVWGASRARVSSNRNILLGVSAIFLLLQMIFALWILGLDRRLGGDGKGLVGPISIIACIIVFILMGKVKTDNMK
jgi:tryptophan-rich sensory protein